MTTTGPAGVRAANLLAQRLNAGQAALGSWCIVASPTMVEVAARAGLHFVLLDMEHGVYDLPALEACIRAAEGAGSSPLVRVPSIDRDLIQSCLDLGAHGVVVPQITGVADARAVLAATTYPPAGTRGFNPFTRAAGYGSGSRAGGFALNGVLVENRAAYAELDEILALPGIDIVYLGVYDMSVELGHPGDVSAPAVQEFLEDAVRRIRAAGRHAGAMSRDAAGLEPLLALGVTVLVHGVDTDVYRSAVARAVAVVDAHANEPSGGPA